MGAPGSEILEAVAEARWGLFELGHRLRARPEVERFDLVVSLNPSHGPGNIPLSISLEALLGNGEPLTWDIFVTWPDDWRIASQVTYGTHHAHNNFEIVRELPDRRATTSEEFIQCLRETATELVATAEEIDVAGFAKRIASE